MRTYEKRDDNRKIRREWITDETERKTDERETDEKGALLRGG